MITDTNSEDRLVQRTFAEHLRDELGWESVYAWNQETFGPAGTLGRSSEQEVVIVRDLRAAMVRLNPGLPNEAVEQALAKLTGYDYSRSLLQHNQEHYKYIRDGVPVSFREEGQQRDVRAKVIDFENGKTAAGEPSNRFLVVRELKVQGLRVPHYNRRADLVCYVNGLPLVFIECKAVHKNIRRGFDENLTDYMTEQVIPHAFHHNAFLVVSNGDKARYSSITGKWEHFVEWKRNSEKEKARVDAEALLDGMLRPDRLLDIVESFVLFDESRAGGTRKIVARNHQVLGVNNALASVVHQEELKRQFPEGERLRYVVPKVLSDKLVDTPDGLLIEIPDGVKADKTHQLPLVERAHPDLGRLGVFWHTQGSGKSYSMAFFAEKVRRKVPGSFTFVVMTDRDDLDDQIFRTFVGVGSADENTPRAASGKGLEKLLKENHRFIFTLIQKFRREKPPKVPWSTRDDIIVLSDEAHRTQAGKLARNMRLALPNACFIGFTGTPLFKYDHLTRRMFGGYVSRYDFRRAEQDGTTVKLIYENRGEKLGIARLDLNERIADKVEEANLNPDQTNLLEKLLGKDYEVITADDRLDKLADDFVEHCSGRWETGKSMLVCIDKVTCGRMHKRIMPRWQAKLELLKRELPIREAEAVVATGEDKQTLERALEKLRGRIRWMESTRIAMVISAAQGEVKEFAKWDVDIVPHRALINDGFETPDGRRVAVDDAFKNPDHPFRVAIVCAMWLTGFDVECLSTMYIDKPMKAHTLMQAIARPNRVFPGKQCGVIVDYNCILRSFREALAQYATGDDRPDEGENPAQPIEALVRAFEQAISEAENHLRSLGFDPTRLVGSHGFDRIEALRDATEALKANDEAKRRFEVMARQVFALQKTLIVEPAARAFDERHDDIEAIYRKLQEHRDTTDVIEVLKEIHRIVNEAIRTAQPGDVHVEALTIDLSKLDFDKLREEFKQKVRRKNTALQDIREVIEKKLQQMLARNPLRMDYYKRYAEIIAEYNREKDRVMVEKTFARLAKFAASLDEEGKRAAREGLTEDELAVFDLLYRESISKAERERLKQASKSLLASLVKALEQMPHWTLNTQTQAQVEVLIRNQCTVTCRFRHSRSSPRRRPLRGSTSLSFSTAPPGTSREQSALRSPARIRGLEPHWAQRGKSG